MSRSPPVSHDCLTDLLTLDGNCGPVSVWIVLRHFKKQASSREIIRACRHTKTHGTFTISLAVASRESGLRVQFHSDPDPSPQRSEQEMYVKARVLGIPLYKAISVKQLTAKIVDRTIAIVAFDSDEHIGHFSPLTAVRRGRLILPYTERGSMPIDEFDAKWRAPGICRQCIIVSP